MNEDQVKHVPEKRKFMLPLEDGSEALLEYDVDNEQQKEYTFYHTEVPPQHKGKGLAAIVAKGAFQYAEANGWKLRCTCDYLTKNFLPKFAQFQKLIRR